MTITSSFILKCRLCGEKRELHTNGIGLHEMRKHIYEAICENENRLLKGVRDGIPISMLSTHMCKEGSIGITDLIGITFNEEKDN